MIDDQPSAPSPFSSGPAPVSAPSPVPPARPPSSGAGVLLAVFGGFFVLFLVFLGVAYMAVSGRAGHHPKGDGPKIGVVVLEGVIGQKRDGVEGTPEAEQIRDFAQDDEIKAIVIRIDSPGGAVAPSQEIWEEIKRTRKKKKVVCSQGNLAASGGYYISVACDEIVANQGTLTGSIGVISQFMDAKELVALAKVVPTVLKTGALKDSGSPLREFNDEDRTYFTGLLNDIFEQFLGAVAEGRKLPLEDVRKLADGRVYTGTQALQLKLVDKIGNFRTAVDRTMELAGLTGEPVLVYPEKEGKFELLQLLQGGARSTGASFATGAIDAATQKVLPSAGILLLAPELASGRLLQ